MPSPLIDVGGTHHQNRSEYTLATVDIHSPPRSPVSERSQLLSPSSPSYGTTELPPHLPLAPRQSRRRLLLTSGVKLAAIFLAGTILLGGTLWLALPTLDPEDRPNLRIPKSFAQLQALNALLKKYRDIYPYRIFICFVTTYLFLQAFSLPGSMYLSILGGAVWGVPRALPLCCACVATGATLCYLLSAALGPALLALPSWHARFHTWSTKIAAQRDNLMSFLIVLRIAPLPPHWVVNVLAPHLGIGIAPFWASTFLGIFGVTVIHTTIGGGLDDMTSAADFHLISWKNGLGLGAVVVGVLIPVALRYYFRAEVESVQAVEAEAEVEGELLDAAVDEEAGERLVYEDGDEGRDRIVQEGPRIVGAKDKGVPTGELVMLDDDDDDEFDGFLDDEEDIILEAGPAVVLKPEDVKASDEPHSPASSSNSRS
ncbi:hypothetical protein PUNSTDRAFT_92406 [Punctularia strigosozonata HHB-11173 SS5]|uniref:Uncharacterized protein n=1 Tax=Punctularia strigosozonata (strain HHB-11173) TaxID=741275 RepID=R7S527_PUNST|nr:uncharacterized protein PUNSTDRAFT_92406 [Punctularia strigosozonata HHB-11173 SS5]EIN04952.1 hypothetical protein PUNSTDRAFT_92406 [Punctularia strigosozonata HHB-11173 SS5]